MHRSLEAAALLDKQGISCSVIDLRSAAPLDKECILNSVAKTGKMIVVDEDYRQFGLSGEIGAIIIADKDPGPGYPDPEKFSHWLEKAFGLPDPETEIIIIGLVLDCCVMCTGQELSFRGYRVRYLVEGVDCYSGSAEEKSSLLERFNAFGWGERIDWKEI